MFCTLLLLAFPPIPKADALPPITAEMWKTSADRLKQIGLALHNYHDLYGQFPQNITDAKGKVLLSWRVQLLPFLEKDELFQQFKLTEPYDSPHNAKLVEKMPEVFAPVRVKPTAGQTYFQGFDGPGAIFDSKTKVGLSGIVDGTSTTAMVVEADKPVAWTKPEDLPFDAKADLPKLGGLFDGAWSCLLADGSVVRIRKEANAASVKNLIRRNDGHPIDMASLQVEPKR